MLLTIVGLCISYCYSYLVLPSNECGEPMINPTLYPIVYKGMIIIPYNNLNAIHLHHWVLYFSIYIISIFVYIPAIFVGFSSGLFIQGIQYKDRCSFICKNPY